MLPSVGGCWADPVNAGAQQRGLISDDLLVMAPSHHLLSRLRASAGASTSGRHLAPLMPSTLVPPHTHAPQHSHSTEIVETIIRLQNERLRLGLEEATKTHYRTLFTVLEQRVAKHLEEKQSQLEETARKNAHLEEKMRVMSAQSQFWFEAAHRSEAVVSDLRKTLQQALQQQQKPRETVEEDEHCWGSTEGGAPVDDAQSSCEEEQLARPRGRNTCRRCGAGDREVCVLLLPCRHLCLCKDCEPKLDTCPVCHSPKQASLRVFMP